MPKVTERAFGFSVPDGAPNPVTASRSTRAFCVEQARSGTASLYSRFLGIPADSLDSRRGHLNRRIWTGRLEEMVPREHMEAEVARLCEARRAQYFSEVTGREDARALRERGDRAG